MTPSQSATARAKTNAADPAVAGLERPTPAGANAPGFGSDVIADALRSLDIPYIALTPGASYRGLHDSIVNYLGNSSPQMLLCLHEEAAVAIAHGYAKVTGKAMAAAVHSNVGLMHATMAIFNAWCDRMPVLVIGATGPVDAAKRRPWIDWIHTARDQGALVREYTKWDDQPASPGAAREAILRGTWISNTAPQGPVYINFDAELQEMKVSEQLPTIDVARFMPTVSTAAPADLVKQAAAMLKGAKQVLILAGRASRSEEAWNARVALAEALNARVVSDLKIGATFPTDHPLYLGAPRAVSPESVEGLKNFDVVLSLDWVDLAGALRYAGPNPSAKVIQISLDHRIHNGTGRGNRQEHKTARTAERAHNVRQGAVRFHQRAHRARLAQSAEGPPGHLYTSAAVVGRYLGGLQASARLCRLRWRRRRWRRPRHFHRRRAGAQGLRPLAGGDLRRWRFFDGRHRGVDRGALQDPAAVRARQQSLVL